MAVDDEHVVLGHVGLRFFARDRAVEFALGRIVLEEVGEIVGGHEIVHRDDIDRFAEQSLFRDGAKDEPSDAPEAIDADFCHGAFFNLSSRKLETAASASTVKLICSRGGDSSRAPLKSQFSPC